MVTKPNKKKESKHMVNIPADVKQYIDIVRTQSNEDMERHIVRVRKEANEDLRHHMSALIEHTDDRIAGIGERFVDFDRILNSHTEMIVELAKDITILTGNVATLTKDVSIIKEKVTSIENGLNKKVDRTEFIVLERRVSVMEVK